MRDHPQHGIQVFSAPSDAPRVHRINDLVTALAAVGALVVLGLVAEQGTQFDVSWSNMAGNLPGWILWALQCVYVVTLAYTVSLVVCVAVFARNRLELARDLVLAAALAGGLGAALGRLVDDRWPQIAVVTTADPSTTFPAFFVAVTTAVQAAAAPHLSEPMRRWGWGLVLTGAAASLVGNLTQPSDVGAALLVGSLSAAVIRLIFGTTAGLPSSRRVAGGLADVGLELSDLRYLEDQPLGSALLVGTASDGTPALVRVLGRDAWHARRWTQMWRYAWYQEDGSQLGHSRREQVEHEALALLLAARSGTKVSDLLGVGVSAQEDAMVAVRRENTKLAELDPGQVDDALLEAIWQQVELLHEAGLSHGHLNSTDIWLDAGGAPVLSDLAGSSMSAPDQQLDEDVVGLLVTTALIVGADRATAAARDAIGDAGLAAVLPVMQPAALGADLRRDAHHQKLKMGDLRKQVAIGLGVDEPPLQKLTRVDPKKILMAAFGVFASYTIISKLADVGFSTIGHAVSDASWPTLVLALLVVACTNATDALSLVSLSAKPVPVGLATIEQFAISFVNIAVPSSAGRLTVNIRFFQKFGIAGVTSTSTSMIASFMALLGQVILLTLAIVVGKRSIDLSSVQLGGGVVTLLGLVVGLVVVGLVFVLAVPKLRHAVGAKLQAPVQQFRDAMGIVKQPRNLFRSLAATIASEILYAFGLVLCVQALGGSLSLGSAVFINITVTLFAGLSPIPGGIGVAEAGLTAGLRGVGVPSDIAVAAVLLYRMVSYYLPPLWGWFGMKWLTKHDFL
jgi:uncharacterized protein (TIRG00374 family)